MASAVGLASAEVRGISPVGELAFIELGLSEALARVIELGLAAGLLVSAGVLLLPRFLVGVSAVRLASSVVALGILATALARTVLGGVRFSDWTLAAEAARFAVPAALLWLTWGKLGRAFWLLRLGAAVTFATHGFEALAHSPRFIDLVLITDARLGSQQLLDEAGVRLMLTCIGWIDLALAALCLVLRSRPLWLYMAFWGLLTAASRVTAGGLDWWPAALERLPNAGAPLALVLLVTALPPRTAP